MYLLLSTYVLLDFGVLIFFFTLRPVVSILSIKQHNLKYIPVNYTI